MVSRSSPRIPRLGAERVPVKREQQSLLRQRARSAELDTIRLQRRLTDAECAEADRIAHCLYMRVYRQRRAELGTPVS